MLLNQEKQVCQVTYEITCKNQTACKDQDLSKKLTQFYVDLKKNKDSIESSNRLEESGSLREKDRIFFKKRKSNKDPWVMDILTNQLMDHISLKNEGNRIYEELMGYGVYPNDIEMRLRNFSQPEESPILSYSGNSKINNLPECPLLAKDGPFESIKRDVEEISPLKNKPQDTSLDEIIKNIKEDLKLAEERKILNLVKEISMEEDYDDHLTRESISKVFEREI